MLNFYLLPDAQDFFHDVIFMFFAPGEGYEYIMESILLLNCTEDFSL